MRHLPALFVALATALPAAAETIAVMPVRYLDTAHEADDDAAVQAARGEAMQRGLAEALPDAVLLDEAALAACPPPQDGRCLLDLARDTGAERALFVVVHKSSTLIMQIYATLAATGDGAVVLSRNLNFRGDSDESWQRATGFLARQLR